MARTFRLTPLMLATLLGSACLGAHAQSAGPAPTATTPPAATTPTAPSARDQLRADKQQLKRDRATGRTASRAADKVRVQGDQALAQQASGKTPAHPHEARVRNHRPRVTGV